MDHSSTNKFIHDARSIILRLKDRQPVSNVEVQELLDRVFALSESHLDIERKMFILAIEIFEHYRDPSDHPLEDVDQLVFLLNELSYLANHQQ